MFYFSEDFFSKYIGDTSVFYLHKIFLIPIFTSFVLGIASSAITLSTQKKFNSGEDMEFFKENPVLRFLVWREIREEIDRG